MNRYRVYYNIKDKNNKTIDTRMMLIESENTNEAKKEVKFKAWLQRKEKVVITKTEIL